MLVNQEGKPVWSGYAPHLDHTVVGAVEGWCGQMGRMHQLQREQALGKHLLLSTIILSASGPEGSWPLPTSFPSSRTSLSSGHGNERSMFSLGLCANGFCLIRNFSGYRDKILFFLFNLLFSLSLHQEVVAQTMKRRQRREWEARRWVCTSSSTLCHGAHDPWGISVFSKGTGKFFFSHLRII